MKESQKNTFFSPLALFSVQKHHNMYRKGKRNRWPVSPEAGATYPPLPPHSKHMNHLTSKNLEEEMDLDTDDPVIDGAAELQSVDTAGDMTGGYNERVGN